MVNAISIGGMPAATKGSTATSRHFALFSTVNLELRTLAFVARTKFDILAGQAEVRDVVGIPALNVLRPQLPEEGVIFARVELTAARRFVVVKERDRLVDDQIAALTDAKT